MLTSWLLILLLVLPTGGVTRETVDGFETQRECMEYGGRYRTVELREVHFLCEPASSAQRVASRAPLSDEPSFARDAAASR